MWHRGQSLLSTIDLLHFVRSEIHRCVKSKLLDSVKNHNLCILFFKESKRAGNYGENDRP